jgi:hypothetical protein
MIGEKKDEILALDGVSGVSEKNGEVVVYLAADSEELRKSVQAIAGAKVRFVVTGNIDVRKRRDE